MATHVNWRLVGLVVLVACAAVAAWITETNKPAPDLNWQGRQFTLHQTLSRTSDPVIVLGDSIVEVSTLPREICGRAIVNAGVSGASTANDLAGWLAAAMNGKRAAAIVVSLGVNDAMMAVAPNAEAFAARYGALLDRLSQLATRLAVLEITPVEAQSIVTVNVRDAVMQNVKAYNKILRDLAARHGATFVALPAMVAPATLDGVHLNAGGYLAWDQAVMQAAGAVCS